MKAIPWLLLMGLVTVSSAVQFNITVDDNHNSVAYTSFPPWERSVWSPKPLGGTNHGTQYPGASATLRFTGTAVYVYGRKGSDHGFYNVSIDSRTAIQCNGRIGQLGSRALLFSTSDLGQGHHAITITHTGVIGERLDIDYFLVTSSSEASLLVIRAPLLKRTTSIAVIAGGAGGGTVIILFLLMLIFHCIGRRRRRLSGIENSSVLVKRSRAPRVPIPKSTHYPGPSTEPFFDPHTSSHYLYNSNPNTTQEYNPYRPTAQISVHHSDPRSTLGSASMSSNPTLQVAQTVPNRRSPESRPLSTVSQPLSTVSQPLSTVSQPLSIVSQSLSTISQPISLRPHQPGIAYQHGTPYQHGGSDQQRRENFAGIGAGTGPLVMSYDANAEQSRFTHLPEKRRPEEMDPVYHSSSNLNLAGSSSAPIHPPARMQNTYRPAGTEQDGMPPPPEYYKERR